MPAAAHFQDFFGECGVHVVLDYRRKHRFGHGSLAWSPLTDATTLAFLNTSGDGTRTVLVVTNFGPDPVPLPEGDVIIASSPLTDDGAVPTDTTVWLRLPSAS